MCQICETNGITMGWKITHMRIVLIGALVLYLENHQK